MHSTGENARSAVEEERQRELEFDPPLHGPVYKEPNKKVLVLNVNSAIRCGELNRKMYADIQRFAKDGYLEGTEAKPRAAAPMAPEMHNLVYKLEDIDKGLRKYVLRDVAHVTSAQRALLRDLLKKERNNLGSDWADYLKVAVVHHHLTTFPGQQTEHKGYEATVDSSQLLELLTSFNFDIVLTGHKHHPRLLPYRFNDKEIFILGGATVGGYAAGGSFRGFNLVEFESDDFRRTLSVRDIKSAFARGDIGHEVEHATPEVRFFEKTPEEIMAHAYGSEGFYYRDVVSTTRITADGDGLRIVECDDLRIRKNCERSNEHPIDLPPTSGYLDKAEVKSKSDHCHPEMKLGIPPGHTSQSARIVIDFVQGLPRHTPMSYQYQWWAVNAFAMDKLQYERKYGATETPTAGSEFTHYVPVDPIERLTILVQFPEGMVLPYPPKLRITRVSGNPDSKTWEPDDEATQILDKSRALRYFDSLRTAALRVKVPKKGLSYGIEWTLPKGKVRDGHESLNAQVDRVLSVDQESKLKLVTRALEGSRKTLLRGWLKDLDGTLMIFTMEDKVGKLKAVAAGLVLQPLPEDKRVDPMSLDFELDYGDGIAGRAFKANQIRVYVKTDDPNKSEPDFYKPVEGPRSRSHRALVAFPVHIPVKEEEYRADNRIYQTREPYGVLTIGSESADCPMDKLLLESRAPELNEFQHFANNLLAGRPLVP